MVIQLGPGVGRPSKSFHVQTEDIWQTSNPELFSRRLLRLAGVAEESFCISQFFCFDKFL